MFESISVCKRVVKERQCTPPQVIVHAISICIVPQHSLYYLHIVSKITSSRPDFPDSFLAFPLTLHPHAPFNCQRAENSIERHACLNNKLFPPPPNVLQYIFPHSTINTNTSSYYDFIMLLSYCIGSILVIVSLGHPYVII